MRKGCTPVGLNRYYPVPTDRMGALLSVHGIENSAVNEFGPMGTANYYQLSSGHYGIEPHSAHFSVHTTDMDISLGRYAHLLDAVSEVETTLSPEIIFLFASSLMGIIGSDMEGIITEASNYIKTPVIVYQSCNLGRHYMFGIHEMLKKLVSLTKSPNRKEPLSYNIIGCLPDDFHFASDLNEIKRLMTTCFCANCICTFPYRCSIQNISSMGEAQINLVIRREGLSCAQELQNATGTPYIYLRPYGAMQTQKWIKAITGTTGWELNEACLDSDIRSLHREIDLYKDEIRRSHSSRSNNSALISGNYDTAKGISEFLNSELDFSVFPWTRDSLDNDVPLKTEMQWEQALLDHPNAVVLSDGVVKNLCKNRAEIISHPSMFCKDITKKCPFVGINGALNILQLIDNCRYSMRISGIL